MKKYALSVVILTLAVSFFLSQRPTSSKSESRFETVSGPHSARAIAFGVSRPVSEIAESRGNVGTIAKDISVRQLGADGTLFNRVTSGHDVDRSLAEFGSTPMPAPSLSFAGLSNIDNAILYSLLIIPPDMNGDVGPNHYVQVVNSLFRVFDKNGQPMSQPLKISSLFESLGTVCSTRIDGLAVVLYDPLADRWIITQTCTAFPPFREMVAISKTGDPLGQYYAYEFVMPNVKLNDFPKFGVWPDAYYMSTDEFLGSDYVGAGAFAFDRAKLLAGDPTASYVYFNLQVPVGPRQKGLLPSDMDGLRPPPTGGPNVFASYTATEYGDAQDALRLYNFHADFNDPFGSTFTERSESPLAVAAFDPTSPEGRADISQPAPGEKLDSQSDRLNFRLAYRNFGTHESLVVNQTVRTSVDPYRAGVRVYELRKSNSNYAVVEQTTIGGGTTSRWIGSAAQDHQGNLAVQYNSVADDKQPSIFYTGKLAGDPAGQFRPERSLIQGTGVQKAFGWRWGEYSGMTVDPVDDCTFWMTNAYYSLESQEFSDFGWLTQIGSFKFAECTPAPIGSITGVVTNSANAQPINGAVVKASAYTRATNAAGSYGSLSVLPGTYEITAAARGYLPQTISVSVAGGQSLQRNFALQPVPIIENAGIQLASESCAINQAPEPGETVTFNISLQNTGVLSATSLTATLLPSNEIVDPSPAQSYGTVSPGAPSVSRAFTFTIAPSVSCGAVVTLNLELRDGGVFVGNVSIPLQTGVRRFALQENFDGVTAPALPNGWSTSSSENHQLWRTSAMRNQSLPNSLYSPAPFQQGINEVVSPAFPIASTQAEIQFRNWYELETTFLRNRLYDGSVLEIKIGDSDWQDILAAGGAFISGGYDGTIDGCCMNPLAGRLGWSGRSGVNQVSEFITTRAKLPAAAAGQNVRLRFRIGSDIGGFKEGQYVDNLTVTDGFVCACETGGDAPFDFDGDGKTDIGIFRPNGSASEWWINRSSTGQTFALQFGASTDRIAPADYTGDGKSDVAFFRPASGEWYVLRSEDFSFFALPFGTTGDVLVPADYDADGKADFAVFRPSSSTWFISQSSGAPTRIVQFGVTGDQPVVADYDADGKADIGIFRPAAGEAEWWIQRSTAGLLALQFGASTDKAVQGDYTGDGKADVAVWRPSTGEWFIVRSEDSSFYGFPFGASTDVPAPGDYDGDGKFDATVFRPSSATWFIARSTAGTQIVQFGATGDRPIPNAFVP